MIKAVIFDLDGVIVSTDNLHYQAWKKMADIEGIYFDKTINHRLRGISRMHSLEIILERASKEYSDKEKVAMATFKNNYYIRLLEQISSKDILPGINELLAFLREKGIKIAIGSSSRNARRILEKLGIIAQFDAISDGTNITHSKPDPEVFLVAADKLDIDPIHCAVVEDALSGIEAAKRANMFAFATGDACSSEEKDYDFSALYEVILQNNKE